MLRTSLVVVGGLTLVNLLALLAYAMLRPDVPTTTWRAPERMLILAAHQDDCVLQAGGAALANLALGGSVDIVYLTRPEHQREATVRRREAIQVWRSAGVDSTSLHFLDLISPPAWDGERRADAERLLARMLDSLQPSVAMLPLEEHGHRDHDFLAAAGGRTARAAGVPRVVHSAEYNPFLMAEVAPAKVLWFVVRLLPFVPYDAPNSGLYPSRQQVLAMDDAALARKRAMVEGFTSQRDVIPVEHFAYPDRYEAPPPIRGDSVHPPVAVVRVGQKRLSAWTVLTLGLVFLACALAGAVAGRAAARSAVRLAAACVALALLLLLAVSRPALAQEELLLPLLFTGTLCASALLRRWQSWSGARRHPT